MATCTRTEPHPKGECENYKALTPVGTKFAFASPYEQMRHRNGQMAEVVGHITEPGPDVDEEVLPMYRIRFEDGTVTEAWPEEVEA